MTSTATQLRENEIRPDELMRGQAERFAADVKRLLDRREEFIAVPCPACGEDRSHREFQKNTLDYVRCSECDTLYISPRPVPPVLDDYYRNSENYAYWSKHIFPASEGARREKIFRPRVQQVIDICRTHGVPTGTLLEVGAGFGTFCEEMKTTGFFERIIAVEPTPDLAEVCRGRGLEVIEKPIEHIDFAGQRIDVVVSFEVIEHLFSPRDYIRSCASILSDGGLLVVTCPNVMGFDIVTLGSLSSAVDPEHLNYFNPKSLSHLVAECGFEVMQVLTPGKLDAELVRKKALAGEFDLASQPFLKQVLIDEWDRVGDAFQQFLADNQLSSHMWLVARKKGASNG
jgi:2-polyprenyl-3-methyl-5-hydroxy-6-metoxy-1,4-benzoquinol methylase